MNTNTAVIDNMKRITLSLETGPSPNNMKGSKPVLFQFIYGVGTQGLCLFEKALFGKKIGEELFFQLDPYQTDEMFGHLEQQLIAIIPLEKPCTLKSTITAIETADKRELVRAIAKGSGSNDCGCGCGC